MFGVHAQDLGAQALQLGLWLQVILTPEQIEKGETLRCSCSSWWFPLSTSSWSHNTVADVVSVTIITQCYYYPCLTGLHFVISVHLTFQDLHVILKTKLKLLTCELMMSFEL